MAPCRSPVVGQGRRGHDAAFGQHVGLGRALAELGPELDHFLGLPLGALAVHEDGQVLGGVGQVAEGRRWRAASRQRPDPVGGQPGHLAHFGDSAPRRQPA